MGRLPVTADGRDAAASVAAEAYLDAVGRRVLEDMPVGFLALAADWRISYVNPAGEAVVGQTREQLIGADYWTAFPANVDNAFGEPTAAWWPPAGPSSSRPSTPNH